MTQKDYIRSKAGGENGSIFISIQYWAVYLSRWNILCTQARISIHGRTRTTKCGDSIGWIGLLCWSAGVFAVCSDEGGDTANLPMCRINRL